jgi:predicted PolB exonuclease-like 3'-5' exonuclease
LDLCDVFGSYGPGTRVKLDEICQIVGLPGKSLGIDGGDVEAMVRAGRINEVAQYCEADVLSAQGLNCPVKVDLVPLSRARLLYEHRV